MQSIENIGNSEMSYKT